MLTSNEQDSHELTSINKDPIANVSEANPSVYFTFLKYEEKVEIISYR